MFLTDFHLLRDDRKPAILAIDSLDCFLENRNLQPMTKQMRLHYLISLVADTKRYLNQSLAFDANNLIVSYRCSPQTSESTTQQQHSDQVQASF